MRSFNWQDAVFAEGILKLLNICRRDALHMAMESFADRTSKQRDCMTPCMQCQCMRSQRAHHVITWPTRTETNRLCGFAKEIFGMNTVAKPAELEEVFKRRPSPRTGLRSELSCFIKLLGGPVGSSIARGFARLIDLRESRRE